MTQQYNAPTDSSPSSVGVQITTHAYERKALIEARREMFFGQLADVTSMPKNMGKEIKRFHYLPILDDSNINDQGLDAAGAVIATTEYTLAIPSLIGNPKDYEAAGGVTTKRAYVAGDYVYCANGTANTSRWKLMTGAVAVGGDASAGTSKTNTQMAAVLNTAIVGGTFTVLEDVITCDSLNIYYTTEAAATAAAKIVGGSVKIQRSGNLYGSSKDIGLIPNKIPLIHENAGKVNGVGMTRIDLTGTMENFGFHASYTADSLNFDTDADLLMHTNRELMNAAMKITEDALQIDLINNAGVVRYTGNATDNYTLNENDELTYRDLMQLSIDLDNNRCPKQTTVITGTRLIDTKVIPACRVAYIGSELIPTLEAMEDLHGNPAFIPVEAYAAGTTVLTGERGRIGDFRFIIVPDMVRFSGQGGYSTSATFYDTNGMLDVFPILVVGEESFTTIGFNTDGKSNKFKTKNMKPDELYSLDNPFGKKGFMSIEWWYGFLLLRGERLALIKTVGKM